METRNLYEADLRVIMTGLVSRTIAHYGWTYTYQRVALTPCPLVRMPLLPPVLFTGRTSRSLRDTGRL